MKSFLFLGFAFSMIFLSCSTDSSSDSYNFQEINNPIVCVFYGINGLGDLTYNDSVNTGITKAEEKFDFFKISYSPKNWTAAEANMNYIFNEIQNNFSSKHKVLCIFVDEHYIQLLEKNELFAKNLPMTTLLFNVPQSGIPESIKNKVHSVFIPYYGACYAAGKIAKKISETEIEPFFPYMILADKDNQIHFEYTQFFLKGFGINNPSSSLAEVFEQVTEDYFYLSLTEDPAKESGYDKGDDLYKFASLGIFNLFGKKHIVLPLCGGSTLGLLHYASDAGYCSYRVVGFDVDMFNYAPNAVEFSVIVDSARVAYECIEQWNNGNLPKSQIKTFDNMYTAICTYQEYTNFSVSDILKEAVQVENERLQGIAENAKS